MKTSSMICYAAGVLLAGLAHADQTTGGVNWLDTRAYLKPAFVSITVPPEATTANKYWVDMTSGSGSTCSQTSPCGNMDSVLGKPGTMGGPAYIYAKGTGYWSWYNDTIYGSADSEIVIKPWPAGSPGCPSECTATFTGNSNTASTNVHNIIIDGGPNLNIRFQSDSCGDVYSFTVVSDHTTVYRTQSYSACPGGSLLLAVGAYGAPNDVRIINNEFYGCNTASGYQCSAIYAGPASGGGYTNLLIKNNIIRDMGGEGIEINPRVTSGPLEISGNAISNVGKQTCSGGWYCRPGITMSYMSGGGNNGTVIMDNLIWDTGSSCIWDRGGASPSPQFYNNTCYDYGKGTGDPNPQGISGYQNGGTATIQNNIIYAPNGTNPFDGSPFTTSNNLCGAGKNCGSNSQAWSANTVLSTDQTVNSFMRIGSGSSAIDAGVAIPSLTVDYAGGSRPQGAAVDIGAFESSPANANLPAPSNLRILSQ